MKFFIGGQGLFVDGLLVLGRNLEIVDGALKLCPGGFEFQLQLTDPSSFPGGRRTLRFAFLLRFIDETDEQ